MTHSSEFSVEGTASVKDEMGGSALDAAMVAYPKLPVEDRDYNVSLARSALRQGFIAGYRAARAAAPSRDQVSMGALTPEAFGKAAYAFDASDPKLGTYVRLQLAFAAASLVPTAEQGVKECPRCDGTGKMETELRGFEHCTAFDATGKVVTPPIAGAGEEPVAWLRCSKRDEGGLDIAEPNAGDAFPVYPTGDGRIPPVAWLARGIQPDGQTVPDASHIGRLVTTYKGGPPNKLWWSEAFPVYVHNASISQLYSRIGEIQRERDEWQERALTCENSISKHEADEARWSREAVEARLAEAREALVACDRQLVNMFRAACPHGNYGDGQTGGNRFADNDEAVIRARSFHSPKEPGPAGGGE